jgi:hypothetical protein
MVLDAFGNAVLKSELWTARNGDFDDEPQGDSTDGWEEEMDYADSEYAWRDHGACPHRYMRLIDSIWSFRGLDVSPAVEAEVRQQKYTALEAVLGGWGDSGAARVIVKPELAQAALPELDAVLKVTVDGTTRVLQDTHGRRLRRPLASWTSQNTVSLCAGSYPEANAISRLNTDTPDRLDELIEVAIEGNDLVVRRHCNHAEVLLRSRSLTQFVEPGEASVRWFVTDFPVVTYTDVDSGKSVQGPADPETLEDYASVDEALTFLEPAESITVQEHPRHLADEDWCLWPLRAQLAASIQTGNPVVAYYNGNSIGFECQ